MREFWEALSGKIFSDPDQRRALTLFMKTASMLVVLVGLLFVFVPISATIVQKRISSGEGLSLVDSANPRALGIGQRQIVGDEPPLMRVEIRCRHLGLDHVVAHRRVVGRNIKASNELGLRHPPMDLTQRILHATVAAYMGAGARDMRQQDLRDRLGLTPKPTTAGLAPERHLASIEIPQAVESEGRHGAQTTRAPESGRGALLLGLGLVGLGRISIIRVWRQRAAT